MAAPTRHGADGRPDPSQDTQKIRKARSPGKGAGWFMGADRGAFCAPLFYLRLSNPLIADCTAA